MSALNYMELCRLCLVKDRVQIPIFEGEGDIRQIFLKIAACLPVKVGAYLYGVMTLSLSRPKIRSQLPSHYYSFSFILHFHHVFSSKRSLVLHLHHFYFFNVLRAWSFPFSPPDCISPPSHDP